MGTGHQHHQRHHKRQSRHGNKKEGRNARIPRQVLHQATYGQRHGGCRQQEKKCQAIEDPLHEYSRQASALAHPLSVAQVVAPHQLSQSHRQQVVGHVADHHHGEQPADGDELEMREQEPPAERTKHYRRKIESGGRHQVEVVGLPEMPHSIPQVKPEHQKPKKSQAYRQPKP